MFSGTVCEIDIDECDSNMCRNGAACVDGQGEYFCECRQGWEGPICQFVSNIVRENTCVSWVGGSTLSVCE